MYLIFITCLSFLLSVYCDDNVRKTLNLKTEFVNKSTFTTCSNSGGIYNVVEGNSIQIGVTSRNTINYVLRSKTGQNYSEGTLENLIDNGVENEVHNNIIEINNVKKATNGSWLLHFLTLKDVTKMIKPIVNYNNSSYTLTKCNITVVVEDPPSRLWIYMSLVGSIVALIIVGQCVALIYLKSKAQQFSTIERLSKEKRGDNTDREQAPEPPAIETLPRKPRSPLHPPVEMQVAGVARLLACNTPPRQVGKHLPQTTPKPSIKRPVPTPPSPCEEETYECPSDELNSKNESLPQAAKSSVLKNLNFLLKPKSPTTATSKKKNKISIAEKIKDRPKLPLPSEEVYEDIKPETHSKTMESSRHCLPPKIPKALPIQPRLNTVPQKASKPLPPPPKPKKLAPPSGYLSNELDSVLKKRRNVSEANASPALIPRPAVNVTPKLSVPKPRPQTPPEPNPKPPPQHISVEEIDYRHHSNENSSDEEWTYEPLPQYNIYSM